MKSLANKYGDSVVLVLGQDQCRDVALTYGFRKPVTADEVMTWNPSMWPFRTLPKGLKPPQHVDFNKEPGAFRIALEVLYKDLTCNTLHYTKFGKPEHTTYIYATEALSAYARILWGNTQGASKTSKRHVYAVGDNPASDIDGANRHGWESILVRTGVWKEEEHGHGHGATHVVHNVEEAVTLLLEKEGLL
ncbi:hypothetical protein HDV00_000514 [Rhizophlyctis rosea]|nr:hypothetical protein HDV00_000514 [Rhizophlyctis rosea]